MRFVKLTAAFGLCLATLTGCVDLTIGRPIAQDNVKLVRPGLTTSGEVTQYFGTPNHKTKTSGGEIWVYRYMNGKGTCQDLVVSFTGDRVSTFTYN